MLLLYAYSVGTISSRKIERACYEDLADVVNRYRSELVRTHGHELLPSHHHALNCIRRCRNQHSSVMLLECGDCHHSVTLPHFCGHRRCHYCQHHESEQRLQRQRAKLLPVQYYPITFTVPSELRHLFWRHQPMAYDLLLKTAWQTIASFAGRDPRLNG
jgi:hypothetical protein